MSAGLIVALAYMLYLVRGASVATCVVMLPIPIDTHRSLAWDSKKPLGGRALEWHHVVVPRCAATKTSGTDCQRYRYAPRNA